MTEKTWTLVTRKHPKGHERKMDPSWFREPGTNWEHWYPGIN